MKSKTELRNLQNRQSYRLLEIVHGINRAIDRAGITNEKLCEILDISPNTARKYRKSWQNATIKTVYAILLYLEKLEPEQINDKQQSGDSGEG